jgi:8-oxo-dGTP pyrophosphatase MutT (NUDIX family)
MDAQTYKIYFNRCAMVFAPSMQSLRGLSNVYFIDDDEVERTFRMLVSEDAGRRNLYYVLLSDDTAAALENFKAYFPVVVAAGGLVLNEQQQILTIFRNGFWDLPKGKVERDEDRKTAALREVCEETGLIQVNISEKVGITYHAFSDDKNPVVIKETHWYRMAARMRGELKPQLEEGITIARWADFDFFKSDGFHSYESIRELMGHFLAGLTTEGTNGV